VPEIQPDALVPIDSVRPHPDNARVHPPENIESIKVSLSRFGQITPIVIDGEGRILKGNGTWIAARALGWREIQARRIVFSSPEDYTLYRLADNRTGDLSHDDDEVVLAQLRPFLEQKLDVAGLGWSQEKIEEMTANAHPPDFAPGSALDQSPLDVRPAVKCPSCGHEFHP
jgi:ParB-like chromosome segregation protein Spo0J